MSRLLNAMQTGFSYRENDLSESKEALLDCSAPHHIEYDVAARRRRTERSNIVLSFTLLMLVAFSSSAITLYLSSSTDRCTVNEAVRRTSQYSPFLEDTDIEIVKTSMNGSVFSKEVFDSPWAGDTDDPIKEPLWDALEFDPAHTIPLTREQVIRLGKDPLNVAKFDNGYWKMGDEMYVGGFDIFHQIHCLNKLRKALLDGQIIDNGSERFHRMHVRHCVDTLMKHLLCASDAGILTFNWYKDMRLPQPDFAVDKQCRNWKQLIQYRDQHGVDMEKYIEWVDNFKPTDILELEAWRGS